MKGRFDSLMWENIRHLKRKSKNTEFLKMLMYIHSNGHKIRRSRKQGYTLSHLIKSVATPETFYGLEKSLKA